LPSGLLGALLAELLLTERLSGLLLTERLSGLLLTERLLPGLLTERLRGLLLTERLSSHLLLLARRRSRANELRQPRLDVALAVVRLVGDALYEIVDVDSRVEIRRADLRELVEDPVADLPPVRPQHLLDLLRLLLVHAITSLQPAWATGKILPEPRARYPLRLTSAEETELR
jgi:hypothetical protein